VWSLKRGNEFLSYVSLQKLQRLYKQEQNMKAKLRLLAAIRRKKGESIDDIAQALEKPRRTIHGWLHRFEKRRINGAYDKKQPGRTPWLNKSELKKLRRELIKGPPHGGVWTTKLMGEHIERKYNVKYSYDNVYRLVCALGFSIQKARPEHYKTDKNAQEQFKKKQCASHGSIVIADGRSHALMNVQSTSLLTSQEAGRSKEADPS
jgi:transposase